jgi:lysozyme family protein
MAKAPTYRSKWPTYARQWDAMAITSARARTVQAVAKRLHAAKARYVAVERLTGVPWYMVAVIHERESGQRWDRSLAQGDPWNKVSTHVPKGRGPFASWEHAAYDALVTLKGLHRIFFEPSAVTLEKVLYQLERYNGWGYFWKGLASPYLWGASTIQQYGKYVADGKFSATAWDQQIGAATLIRALMDIDKTIKPIRET